MIVDPARLVPPTFNPQEYFPDFRWNLSHDIDVPTAGVIFVDPINVADVYNSHDAVATYLRLNGMIILDFGGDVSGPLWFDDPFVLMPVSSHYSTQPSCPQGACTLIDSFGCDSGSFVLLPFREFPPDVSNAVQDSLHVNDAILLSIPAGKWSLRFEQFDAPAPNEIELYRNIVLERSDAEGG